MRFAILHNPAAMRALCLTLPEQPERRQRAELHFIERGLAAVEFVCGINGPLTGLKATHVYEIDHPKSGYTIGPCTIGIWLSHYIAWSIIAHGPDERVMIFEDDALLTENFVSRTVQALDDAPPDTDILFLGSCCTEGSVFGNIKGEIFDVRYPQCLHAYIVSRTAAQTLVRSYRDVWGPADCLLRLNGFAGLKVLTVLPRLADQVNTNLPP